MNTPIQERNEKNNSPTIAQCDQVYISIPLANGELELKAGVMGSNIFLRHPHATRKEKRGREERDVLVLG